MLSDDLHPQVAWLQEELPRHGWRFAGTQGLFENEWWAAEMWLLESIWSPSDARVYLTFLNDPQGGGVWAVGAGPERPLDRHSPLIVERLGHGWTARLADFVKQMAKLRS